MDFQKEKKLVIIGGGETAELAYEYFEYDSPYKVLAFSVESDFIDKKNIFDLPVIPFEELENHYSTKDLYAFVAISYTKLNRLRTRLYKKTKEKGYSIASYISSKAFIWHNVEIGENCFILENNVIQYGVRIGNNVTLWSGNHIGHRSVIKDNCFVSSHVVISGYCEIGENCFIGVNSSIADFKKIAKDNLIGAGSIIIKNTKEGKIYRPAPSVEAKINVYKYFGIKE